MLSVAAGTYNDPGTPMSLWPRSPYVQSSQPLNLLFIQRQFSCYIRYAVKYTFVINPYLKYRSFISSFEEIQIQQM